MARVPNQIIEIINKFVLEAQIDNISIEKAILFLEAMQRVQTMNIAISMWQ